MCENLEGTLSRHFVNEYYCLLLLPNCHREFYDEWIRDIQQLMVEQKCLHYAVLANAASHLHFVDASLSMQELALTYYSNALRGLSKLLSQAAPLENHDGLLMSVILLYLHGVSSLFTLARLHHKQSMCAFIRADTNAEFPVYG
jgi:hypothetical protein